MDKSEIVAMVKHGLAKDLGGLNEEAPPEAVLRYAAERLREALKIIEEVIE